MSLSSCVSNSVLSSSTDCNDRPAWVIIIHPLRPVKLWEAGPLDFQPPLQQCFLYLFPTDCGQGEGEAHLSWTFYLATSSRLPETRWGLTDVCRGSARMQNRPEERSQECERTPADALRPQGQSTAVTPLWNTRGRYPGIKTQVRIWAFLHPGCRISVKLLNLSG